MFFVWGGKEWDLRITYFHPTREILDDSWLGGRVSNGVNAEQSAMRHQ